MPLGFDAKTVCVSLALAGTLKIGLSLRENLDSEEIAKFPEPLRNQRNKTEKTENTEKSISSIENPSVEILEKEFEAHADEKLQAKISKKKLQRTSNLNKRRMSSQTTYIVLPRNNK
ncbi:Oidioi.mRNA.OKI2018_I69.chr1.g127.t1.cds [Oikopleura dioica]|uniref:Oidioi.mRNA.OKI2018_I69.chr1.g127.t1.cds n=1 Tax=Oikopleura dioica TaxID=34765 RepID=A0ABN7SMM2_OIKDI|nr:Oidioi.mRNA.OKI2018_I69.chr1.g127.t1.cds [Oikopleura dioica]